MDSRMRLTFACGTCLGLTIGFTAGHFSLWNRVPRTAPTVQRESPFMGSGGFDLPAVTPLAPEVPPVTPSPGGAVVLNDPDLGDEPVHAEAIAEVPLPPAPSPLKIGPAKPLSPIPEPTVGTVQQAQQSEPVELEPLHPEIVKMLADELREATQQQREVWSDALRGMTPEDAAGIILMWKKFGQAGPDALHSSAAPPLFSSSHPDPAPLPSAASLKEILSPSAPSGSASHLTRVEEHNLANARTCGYLNLIPVQQELALDAGGLHLEPAGYRLDLLAVKQVPTGNPAHVAVDDGGFLAVQMSTGEVQFTRIGRLVLDAERRLSVDLGNRDLPLTPEIKLPEGAYQLWVANGEIKAVVAGQTSPVDIPPLKMARFFDASRLKPMGGGLYAPTTASGTAQFVPAVITLGVLEFPEPTSAPR